MSDTSRPFVSVVIPAYNNEDFIAETIESALAQQYENFEVVVADHSSRDGTSEVVARFAGDPRIRVLSPTPTGGGARANWNRVTEAARGDLVKLLCGDDLLEPTAVAEQVEAFAGQPEVALVASRRKLVDASGRILVDARGLGTLDGRVAGEKAIRSAVRAGTNLFGEPACVMFRRTAWERAGGWDDRFPYLIDQYTYSRMMADACMVAIPRTLASFRLNATQWSVRLVREQASQAIAYHHAMREAHPEVISKADLVVGNARAILMARMRRLAYLWLRRRM